MHADLLKLLELQAKDDVLVELDGRLEALAREGEELDAAARTTREALEAAQRAVAEGVRHRDELEAKIEVYRLQQERRRQRLEFVRNPKEAATLMAELDLARSVMSREESDWVRSAEAVNECEARARDEAARLAQGEAAQAPQRASLAARRASLEGELEGARRERETCAARIERGLRTRYDRLRRTRGTDVVVPLLGGVCGACHTSIPLNRRSQIRSGQVLDGCEVCGAILYPPEPAGSA